MIWLIGSKGMLGSEVARQLTQNKFEFTGTDKEVDITNPDALESYEKSIITSFYDLDKNIPEDKKKINWIINCSAYTNVDKAEDEPELAQKLNAEGVLNIARLARKIGAKLIHISTDYVFNGEATTPYTEDMAKQATGVYGRTKAEGEDYIEKEMVQYYILRTAWLYGFDGKNFVYTITRAMNEHDGIKVVNDQFGTPTCAVDLAKAIITVIKKNENAKDIISTPTYGIYHFTDEGQTSWYDFATEIYKYGKKFKRITNPCEITPCTSAEYPSKVKRPAYSVLSKEKIKQEFGLKIPSWQKSLKQFMKDKRFLVR